MIEGNFYYRTNQHSCMNPNAHCELVIQYMCGDLVRDGASRGLVVFKALYMMNRNYCFGTIFGHLFVKCVCKTGTIFYI